jgi:hypothetical protein
MRQGVGFTGIHPTLTSVAAVAEARRHQRPTWVATLLPALPPLAHPPKEAVPAAPAPSTSIGDVAAGHQCSLHSKELFS